MKLTFFGLREEEEDDDDDGGVLLLSLFLNRSLVELIIG
jgi:hypothetical protein